MLVSAIIPRSINFAPQSLREEVEQNVYTILNTTKGTVPLDRNFGLSATLIDQPLPAARGKLIAEVISSIRTYEPRFKAEEVTFEAVPGEGVLKPVVKGAIIE